MFGERFSRSAKLPVVSYRYWNDELRERQYRGGSAGPGCVLDASEQHVSAQKVQRHAEDEQDHADHKGDVEGHAPPDRHGC